MGKIMTNIQRIAAFSCGETGGNPAGVVLCDEMMNASDMQRIAAEVGYSETAFAAPVEDAKNTWRVRYFAPQTEIPFCGHATIALGASLAQKHGVGTFELILNFTKISVDTKNEDGRIKATLLSPPTHSKLLGDDETAQTLALFGLGHGNLDPAYPPAYINAGAGHYMIALKDRDRLRTMQYDFETGRIFMQARDLVTVMLVHAEDDRTFHARNAFAAGGVVEDPATGAAASAFAGYLRDQSLTGITSFTIHQGEDMGVPSILNVTISDEKGASVQVSGQTRQI